MTERNRGRNIAQSLELAILLEASAHKPGNVSVVTDFENTRYEHFLASAVASSHHFESAAKRGIAVSKGTMEISRINIGQLIRDCIREIDSWQHGGNTLLGTVILLMPMAAAAGMTPVTERVDLRVLRRKLKQTIECTTPKDAVNLYEAVKIAKPGGLGKAPDLDINDPTSTNRILANRVSLYNVFKIAEEYDSICSEWVNSYPITFEIAYPSLQEKLQARQDVYKAIVQTFLEVLARVPDTFIARKAGIEKAQEISRKAKTVIEQGGVWTTEGKRSLSTFDRELRRHDNMLNPGTTADILSAALALCLLSGYRP